MAEYYPAELGKVVAYEGYFDLTQVVRHLREYVQKLNYNYIEQAHSEVTKADGKHVYIKVDIDRYVSDYVKLRLKVDITCSGLTDVQVKKDNKLLALNDGKINIKFQGWVVTDHEGRYEGRPKSFFWRTILEKFVYGRSLEKFKRMVKTDVDNVIKETKSYLNLLKY